MNHVGYRRSDVIDGNRRLDNLMLDAYTIYNPETGGVSLGTYTTEEAEEIFSTYSQLQVILFLRDLWYVWLGKEIPTDNQLWENIKARDRITLDTYKDVIRT